jgi:hypothetical protein
MQSRLPKEYQLTSQHSLQGRLPKPAEGLNRNDAQQDGLLINEVNLTV